MSAWGTIKELTTGSIDKKVAQLQEEYNEINAEMQNLKARWDFLATRKTEIEGSARGLNELKADLESLLAEKAEIPIPLGDPNDPDDEDK